MNNQIRFEEKQDLLFKALDERTWDEYHRREMALYRTYNAEVAACHAEAKRKAKEAAEKMAREIATFAKSPNCYIFTFCDLLKDAHERMRAMSKEIGEAQSQRRKKIKEKHRGKKSRFSE